MESSVPKICMDGTSILVLGSWSISGKSTTCCLKQLELAMMKKRRGLAISEIFRKKKRNMGAEKRSHNLWVHVPIETSISFWKLTGFSCEYPDLNIETTRKGGSFRVYGKNGPFGRGRGMFNQYQSTDLLSAAEMRWRQRCFHPWRNQGFHRKQSEKG